MKKKLIIMGIGLAVVGTGMIVKKLRNKNNEVEEIVEEETTMETEELEEVTVDEEDNIEILDCEENYVPKYKMLYNHNRLMVII